MEKLPAQMTVVAISKPGGPEVLVPETRRGAAARRRRDPDQGAGRRRQPARCGAALRRLSAAARRERPARPRDRGRSGRRRQQRQAAQDRRQGDVAGRRRRLCAILHRAGRPGDGGAAVAVDPGSRRTAGNPDDGLAQCVRARRAEGRRDAADPWRLFRHRHHGDPARKSVRRRR